MAVFSSLVPVVEVVRVTDPEGTRSIGLCQPLIQAVVQELDVVFVQVDGFVGVPADVRVDVSSWCFVGDFSAELSHCFLLVVVVVGSKVDFAGRAKGVDCSFTGVVVVVPRIADQYGGANENVLPLVESVIGFI